jgi:RNA polymerase sigma-70 factor, ECF subfamily
MNTTSESLLLRVRRPDEAEAWERFVQTYSPLLFGWACHKGLSHADAADLVQDVFAVLVQKLPYFTYDASRGFRKWLWTVMRNRLVTHRRRRQPASAADLDQFSDADGEEVERADFQRYLATQLIPTMRERFHPATWQAFWAYVVEEKPAPQVADELGTTTAAVYKAKVRVLARLQAEFGDLFST